MRVGIVVGGANSVWAELFVARQLCDRVQAEPLYFACNDMIEHFSGDCVCCTLHVQKLPMWLANRTTRGYAQPKDICICTKEQHFPEAELATKVTNEWGGSVGLFAIKCARELYEVDRIILCGVPMQAEGNHFLRNTAWNDVGTFAHRWNPHIASLQGHVRSFSGKTKEWFGEPSQDFITGG